jgi:hypothetical protein
MQRTSGPGFAPPGRHTTVNPSMSMPAIQATILATPPGNTVAFAPGNYRGNLRVANGIYLYSPSPGAAIIEGSFDGSGKSDWTVDSFQVVEGGFAVANSSRGTIGRCDFLHGLKSATDAVIQTGTTRNLSLINTSFRHLHQPSYVPGADGLGTGYAIAGWEDTGLYVGGCVFDDLREGICLDHSGRADTGNGIVLERNYFNRLTRMCIEVDAQDEPGHVGNLICRNNYSENPIPKEDPGLEVLSGAVAWSIVPALGENSEISGNFADGRWTGGLSAIVVELFGSGRVFRNVAVGYHFGCETYNGNHRDPVQEVFDNNFNGSAPGRAPDQNLVACLEGNRNLRLHDNVFAPFTPPAKPSPIAWNV